MYFDIANRSILDKLKILMKFPIFLFSHFVPKNDILDNFWTKIPIGNSWYIESQINSTQVSLSIFL